MTLRPKLQIPVLNEGGAHIVRIPFCFRYPSSFDRQLLANILFLSLCYM